MLFSTAINHERQELLSGHDRETFYGLQLLGIACVLVFSRGLLHLLRADTAESFLMIPNIIWMFAELLSPVIFVKRSTLPFR